MEIVEYDQADPLCVLELNLLSLGYALTPHKMAQIRQLDRRAFPFLALYAIVDGIVAGQVGVDRLPVVTSEGPDEIGGVWAVCTHPVFSRRGIASRLLAEAHGRMRLAGLKYSSLGTARHRGAYPLYRLHGYEPVQHGSNSFARWQPTASPSHLRAERAGQERLTLTDDLFEQAADGHLGFARRHPGFIRMLVETGDLSPNEIWLLWQDAELVGYALAGVFEAVLMVSHLLLLPGIEAAEAVSALAQAQPCETLRVRVDHPSVATSLVRLGLPAPRRDWSVLMVKPLDRDASVENFVSQMGIGSERFMISDLDVT